MQTKRFSVPCRAGSACRPDLRFRGWHYRRSCVAVAIVSAAFVLVGVVGLSSPVVGRDALPTGLVDPNRGVLTVAPTIERAAPAVVNISVASRIPGAENPLFRDPFFRRFFAVPDQVPQREVLSAGCRCRKGLCANKPSRHPER
jgi:S1-C subfamily serine protease